MAPFSEGEVSLSRRSCGSLFGAASAHLARPSLLHIFLTLSEPAPSIPDGLPERVSVFPTSRDYALSSHSFPKTLDPSVLFLAQLASVSLSLCVPPEGSLVPPEVAFCFFFIRVPQREKGRLLFMAREGPGSHARSDSKEANRVHLAQGDAHS